MKKIFIFILIVFVGFAFTSCDWLVEKAEVDVLGVGNIQQRKGGFYVEIDSLSYVPSFVYTNTSGRDGKQEMTPVEGMQVTCFRLYGKPEVYFIAGAQSQEYLEEYFTKDCWIELVFLAVLFLVFFMLAVHEDKRWRKVFHKE